MGRKPKYIFAVHEDSLYVKTKYCGIHPFIITGGEAGPKP